MAQTFPITPADLTAEWLDAQLRAKGAITSSKVVGFDGALLGEGVGMMSVLSRVTLKYDQPEAGAPATVVAKFSAVNDNRAVADAFRVYEREAIFLRDLSPHAGVPVPTIYDVELDLATNNTVILMEDVGDYRMGDQIEGCTLEEAKTILAAVAPVHAKFWGNIDNKFWDTIPHVDGPMNTDAMTAGATAGWDIVNERFPGAITPALEARKADFIGQLRNLHARIGQLPKTIIHGDCRLDNMMFAREAGHYPVLLLDWQGLLVSTGLQDVAYLLTQNLDPELRRANERGLVAFYHSELVRHGVTGYSAEQCWDDYRLAALYLFVYALVISGTLDPSTDRGRAFMSALMSRSVRTIEDLDLFSLL
jgi:tRNA A-37 threonylcarbamoyl transferase component Bud32